MSQDDRNEKRERGDFFISYTGSDEQWAEWIAFQLEEAGYTIIIQAWDFRPGFNFVAGMDNAAKRAERTLLVLSSAYLSSKFGFAEWAAAYCSDPKGERGLVLPVRIEACEIEGLLKPIGYIDLVGLDEIQARERLLRGVSPGRAKPAKVEFPGKRIPRSPVGFPGPLPATKPQKCDTHPPGEQATQITSQPVGAMPGIYDVHSSWVLAVAWEPGGRRIASAGGDGIVRVWDAETRESLQTYRGHTRLLSKINLQTTVYAVEWAPQGTRILSAGHGTTIHVWSADTGQNLILYQEHFGLLPDIFAATWSPDGKYIASACSGGGIDKTVHVWDAATGRTIARYSAQLGLLPSFSVLAIAWSPNGALLAASWGDKTIHVWNTTTGQLVSTYPSPSKWSSHIAWSPDGQYLASAHADHTVQIWDTHTRNLLLTYREHRDGVRRIAWSPHGRLIATASNDRTVHIWEALSGTRIYTYRGHEDWVTCVNWSPDGTRVASASNDKTVHIWQVP